MWLGWVLDGWVVLVFSFQFSVPSFFFFSSQFFVFQCFVFVLFFGCGGGGEGGERGVFCLLFFTSF